MDSDNKQILLDKLSMLDYSKEEKEMALVNYAMKIEQMPNLEDFGLMES